MTFALDRNERVRVDDVEYRVSRRIGDDIYQLVHPATGELKNLTGPEIADRLFSGSLSRIAITAPAATAPDQNEVVQNADFTNCSGDEAKDALHRRAYVAKVISECGRPPYSDAQLKNAMAAARQEDPDLPVRSIRSLRRWLKEQAPSGHETAAQPSVFLANKNRRQGHHASAFPAKVEELMTEVIEERLLVQVPDTVYGAYGALKDRIDDENAFVEVKLPFPSYETFWRRWDALDEQWRMERQLGPRATYRKFGPVGQPRETRWPNHTVEADHNWVASNIIDEDGVALGAGVLTLFLDTYTSMPTGFALSFEPPSYTSDMLALRHAVRPKTYLAAAYEGRIQADWPCAGLPETLIVNNGADLHSSSLKAACDSQGITAIWAEKAHPWQKGHVERAFRTIDEKLTLRLPGAKLSGRKLPDDYDPAKAAKITLKALVELLHMLFADVFPGMPWPYDKTKTRREAWLASAAKFPLRLPRSSKEFEILTRARLDSSRKLRRTGIEAFGMFYDSSEVAALIGQGIAEVFVYYDPGDLKDIFVCPVGDPTTWARADCRNGKYAKKRTLWQHRRILDHLDPDERRRANEDDLLAAHSRLRNRAEELVGRKRRRRRNVKDHTRHTHQPMSAETHALQSDVSLDDLFAEDEQDVTIPDEIEAGLGPQGPKTGESRSATPCDQMQPDLATAAEETAPDDGDDITALAARFTVRKRD